MKGYSWFSIILRDILMFILTATTAGCMVYVVIWLEALRKGWLV